MADDAKEPIELSESPVSPGTKRALNSAPTEAVWVSPCCGRTTRVSKQLLHFLVQFVITLLILVFCLVQLALGHDEKNNSVYFSILSSLVTLYIQPPLPTKEKP